MTETEKYNKLIVSCKEKAFHAFAFEYVFDQRYKKYGRLLNWLKFSSLALPATVGALFLTYTIAPQAAQIIQYVVGALSILLFVVSVWVAAFKIEDGYPYAIESSINHGDLHEKFKKLGEYPPATFAELNHAFDVLNAQATARSREDTKHGLSDKERRMGMRWSLREYRVECAGCKEVPVSMEPTNCGVCGNF